jgi:hypothetical protein
MYALSYLVLVPTSDKIKEKSKKSGIGHQIFKNFEQKKYFAEIETRRIKPLARQNSGCSEKQKSCGISFRVIPLYIKDARILVMNHSVSHYFRTFKSLNTHNFPRGWSGRGRIKGGLSRRGRSRGGGVGGGEWEVTESEGWMRRGRSRSGRSKGVEWEG